MLRSGYKDEAADYCIRESQGKVDNGLYDVAERLLKLFLLLLLF